MGLQKRNQSQLEHYLLAGCSWETSLGARARADSLLPLRRAVYAKRLFKSGVKMVGGCCGTKPHHITQVASAARMFGGGGDIAPPVHGQGAQAEQVGG